jgi:hypothetical protein
MPSEKSRKKAGIEGMLLVLDRQSPKGLKHWGTELVKMGIPAVIQVDDYMVVEHSELLRDLAGKGFDICGVTNEKPFWNESYGYQFAEISRIQEQFQKGIGKKLRLFSSKYFAYNEYTLQITDKLGIEFIFARGIPGADAVTYKAKEYKTRLLSVSNIQSPEMGSGSL